MSFFVPDALSLFSSAGAAFQALVDRRKSARGDAGAIVMELEDNYTYLKMVVKDNIKYRWNLRVKNIIKLIWLLLKLVQEIGEGRNRNGGLV